MTNLSTQGLCSRKSSTVRFLMYVQNSTVTWQAVKKIKNRICRTADSLQWHCCQGFGHLILFIHDFSFYDWPFMKYLWVFLQKLSNISLSWEVPFVADVKLKIVLDNLFICCWPVCVTSCFCWKSTQTKQFYASNATICACQSQNLRTRT